MQQPQPAHQAQQVQQPQQWDYRVAIAVTGDQVEQLLRELGRQGWELGGVAPNPDSYTLFLKRPLPPAA